MLSLDEENFLYTIPHFAILSLDPIKTTMIYDSPSVMTLYKKFDVNFKSFLQILKKFSTGLFRVDTSLHTFFIYLNDLLEFYDLYFYSELFFFCNHLYTLSVIILHHNSHLLYILIICWWNWLFRIRFVFKLFFSIFESFMLLKSHSC